MKICIVAAESMEKSKSIPETPPPKGFIHVGDLENPQRRVDDEILHDGDGDRHVEDHDE
ncbi:MAG TPA: hypothetical protein VHE79_12725 [Spirochaetia bacterium]